MNSWEWKIFYEAERRRLGERGLRAFFERLTPVNLPSAGAFIFPHTRLDASGELIASAALAVVEAGFDEVIALGVLHGGRESDKELVQRARAGEADARSLLRRIHGPGAIEDSGHWCEEFSLDSFKALVEVAARMKGRRAPQIIERYPFLTGANPSDLPGLDELRAAVARGAAVVATTDPIHHGVGYATPDAELLPRETVETLAIARESVARGFDLLMRRDYSTFLEHARTARSDFRDNGPVLRELLNASSLSVEILELKLVDYSDVLAAEPPTWVAAALAVVRGEEE